MSETSPLLSADPSSTSQHTLDDGRPAENQCLSVARGLVISTTIFILIFVLTFGVSILTTIQSAIANDLQVTSSASWFNTSYLIASTSITPIAGKLCEVFSPRSYLLVSTFIQAIGLLLTAFAPTFNVFIIGRVVSGIGSSAVTPVAFILVTELVSQRRRGLMWGLINCGYTAGVAFGAIIGGDLEPRIGWRAVFWTQVPVCLIAGIAAFFAIPRHPTSTSNEEQDDRAVSQKMARIDFLGVLTLISGIVLLLYSLAAPKILATPVALGILLLALFCFVESAWAVEPVVPMSVLSSRAMLLTGLATIGFMCARWAILFYTPAYAIAVRGWTQAHAGVLLIPTNFGFGLGSLCIGGLHIRRSGSFYFPTLICFGLFVVEQCALAAITTIDSSIWLFVAGLFVNGFIAGALLSYNLAHLLYLMRPEYHVIVLPLNAMFRSLSGSIASSLTGGIFVRKLQDSLHTGFEREGLFGRGELIMQLLSRPVLVQKLQGKEHAVAVGSYASSIRYLIVMGGVWTFGMLILQAGTGWTAPKQSEFEHIPNEDTSSRAVSREVEHTTR